MKIYTRTGDDGSTGLFAGERVSKNHPRMEVCGTLDELNALLGAALAAKPAPEPATLLLEIQRQIFSLGADLATAGGKSTTRIGESEVKFLEAEIDRMTAVLPELKNFILPGGTPAAAQIHVARAVCRRCERNLVAMARSEPCPENSLIYLNRLSDFLFTLARFENLSRSVEEEKWSGHGP